MKTLLLLTIFVCYLGLSISPSWALITLAPTYYVKADGGTGDGLSEASAWSLATLNQTNLPPGSTVLFRRGDTFYGTLAVRSGSPGQPTTYGAFGNGSSPIISGFRSADNWRSVGNNIYWTDLDVAELNVVSLDGKLQAMGRYPRTGYLTYNSHQGTSTITSSQGIPFDPTGAEVVIRKIRQITDRHRITAYANNTLSLSSSGAYNTVYFNNSTYQPQDGNGFFIQSSLYTLAQLGDWYYDKAARRLYMHFGSTSPQQHQVRLATLPVLTQLNNISDVSFQEITFEGANREIININNGNRITLVNCTLRLSYGGIAADNGMNKLSVQGGSISQLINNGVYIPQSGSGTVIEGTHLRDIGAIPGAGGSGDATQLGIWVYGDNSTVVNCTLDNIGYHGIVLYGNHTLIEKNVINTFGLVKDDCGGIYEFQFSGVNHSDKIIRHNIVLNGVGVAAGAPLYAPYGQAAGIYLDANVNHVQVYDNILAHGSWGGILLVGVGQANEITHNLTYDFAQGLLIHNFAGLPVRGLTLAQNQFIAKTSQQSTLYLQMYTDDNLSQYGNFNRNIYARPLDDNATITINREYAGGGGVKNMSLAGWQAMSGQDANSTKSAVTTDKDSNLRFDYNASSGEQVVTLDNQYADVSNSVNTASLRLPPYGGSVLVNMGSATPTQPVNNPQNCSAMGLILYEHWDNVPGVLIRDIPLQTAPTWVGLPGSFEGPVNFGNNYASRMRGYICAPQTGQYTFWLAGDDASELWLSSDDNPTNKVRIAWVDSWTFFRRWNQYGSQQSAPITLQAGKKYYIEALHKEGAGEDNLTVQWQLPSGVVESPLPGRYLSPYLGGYSTGRSRIGAFGEGESVETNPTLSVYPNPFSTETVVEFTLPESTKATVNLYNSKGQLMKNLFEGPVEAHQPNRVKAMAEQLPPGLYLLQLISGQRMLVKKAILSR